VRVEAFDVVVVGGGPAGAVAARTAAQGGARVLVLERAPSHPLRCTGLVSPRFLEALHVPRAFVLREICGLRLVPPSGQAVELRSAQVKGCVLDRPNLDRWLLGLAQEAGAEVRLGIKALGTSKQMVTTSAGPVRSERLIGADGPVSGVCRWAGLPGPAELLVGLQALVAAPFPEDLVEVHLGQRVAPGLLAWVVPAEDGVLRVGLATSKGHPAAELLRQFLRRRFPGAPVVGWTAGLIPIGPPRKTAHGNVLLVGDAAAQVKPLTGGGLFFGTCGARLAGQAVLRSEPAAWYERSWRRTLGKEITFGLRARRLVLGLEDKQLDQLVKVLSDPALRRLIAEKGDLDFPSRLVRASLARPEGWRAVVRLFPTLGPKVLGLALAASLGFC